MNARIKKKKLKQKWEKNKDRIFNKFKTEVLDKNKQYPFIDLPNMECDNNGNYIYIKENKE